MERGRFPYFCEQLKRQHPEEAGGRADPRLTQTHVLCSGVELFWVVSPQGVMHTPHIPDLAQCSGRACGLHLRVEGWEAALWGCGLPSSLPGPPTRRLPTLPPHSSLAPLRLQGGRLKLRGQRRQRAAGQPPAWPSSQPVMYPPSFAYLQLHLSLPQEAGSQAVPIVSRSRAGGGSTSPRAPKASVRA